MKTKEEILSGIFTHTPVEMPDDCILKISPSMISKFFDYPTSWYKEVILETEKFEGNTATTLGSMCHAVYESIIHGIKITREEFDAVLKNYCSVRSDIDYDEVSTHYPSIATLVANEFLLKDKLEPQYCEIPLISKIMDGVYIGGHCDYIPRGIVTDWKTVGAKPSEDKIPWHYKIQLLAYRHAAKACGIYVDDWIQIVYGVRALKKTPPRCFVVREKVTQYDEMKALDTFKLIGESVLRCKKDPTLVPLIFKSRDLTGD